jgi:hypothetical protein
MATPWVTSIRSVGKLSVALTDEVRNGLWGPAFIESIATFNSLMKTHNIGVQMAASATPPDPNGPGGADLLVDVGSGTVTFEAMGSKFSVDLGTGGTAHTQSISVGQGAGSREMVKAFVFLPKTFDVQVGPAGQIRMRPAGKFLRTCVLTHEFIHCCGLSNAEHSAAMLHDIFIPQIDSFGGATPDQDKANLGGAPAVLAPPFKLSTHTASVIRTIW